MEKLYGELIKCITILFSVKFLGDSIKGGPH